MNPALNNLEYVTRAENQIHALRYGRRVSACPLSEDDVRRVRELYAVWYFTKRVLAQTFGVNARIISDIVNNRRLPEPSPKTSHRAAAAA